MRSPLGVVPLVPLDLDDLDDHEDMSVEVDRVVSCAVGDWFTDVEVESAEDANGQSSVSSSLYMMIGGKVAVLRPVMPSMMCPCPLARSSR